MRCNAMQCNAMQCNPIQSNAKQCDTPPLKTANSPDTHPVQNFQPQGQAGRQAGRQTDTCVGRHAGRQTGRQAGRQADRPCQPCKLSVARDTVRVLSLFSQLKKEKKKKLFFPGGQAPYLRDFTQFCWNITISSVPTLKTKHGNHL